MTTHQVLHTRGTDTWLTPPELIRLLGPFDTDPCCPPDMPWKTAAKMITEAENGLTSGWVGRVWLNPPYSNVMPWAEKMVAWSNGIALISAKSVDARWAQLMLRHCSAVHALAGRLVFCRPDGTPADGKWLSNLVLSFDRPLKRQPNAAALRRPEFLAKFPGTAFVPR